MVNIRNVAIQSLECCGWLLGHGYAAVWLLRYCCLVTRVLRCYYAVAKVLWVVARALLCIHHSGCHGIVVQRVGCYGCLLGCCYSVIRVL